MPKKKQAAASTLASAVEPIVVKIVQSVRPNDVLVIECDQARTSQQLEHLHKQLKAKLPDVRIVILNAGARLANAQTLATLAGGPGA